MPFAAVCLAACLGAWVAACERSDDAAERPALAPGRVEQEGAMVPRGLYDSLQRQLDLLQAVSAEKDSALDLVRQAQDFIDEIDRELSVMPGVSGGVRNTLRDAEGGLDVDVGTAIRRKLARALSLVEHNRAAIAARDARIRALRGDSAARSGERAQVEATVASLETIIERQRADVERLSLRLQEAEDSTRRLALRNDSLERANNVLSERDAAVYIVAGTADELLRTGVIVRAGGARIVFWRAGSTLQPARDAPASAFTQYDMERARVIPLPRVDVAYRIVSTQNPVYLDPAQHGAAVIRGALRIANPRGFWAASRYLILVEQ